MLINVAFSAIVNLIKNTGSPKVCQAYLEEFIKLFQQTHQIKDKEQRETVKRGLCTGINVCLYGYKINDPELMKGIYKLIIDDFAK